jgi:predicted RNA-binding Zn-ribbon protein involved in translation (DUF1610 family)
MIFVNLSNHPSEKWADEQREKALELVSDDEYEGAIIDIAFPSVPPEGGYETIEGLAKQTLEKIKTTLLPAAEAVLEDEMRPTPVIHLMGEQGFCFTLTQMLLDLGLRVVHSTTRREVVEKEDGTKESRFSFVRFRPYAPTKQGRWRETAKEWAAENKIFKMLAAAKKEAEQKETRIESELKTSAAAGGKTKYSWTCPICGEEISACRPMPKTYWEPESPDGRPAYNSMEYIAPEEWVKEKAYHHRCPGCKSTGKKGE